MFAPWCPTCSAHVLLGTRRIEHLDHGPSGPRVVIRCYCDTLLVWSSASDDRSAGSEDRRGRAGPEMERPMARGVAGRD